MVMPNTTGRPVEKNEFKQLRLEGVSRQFGGANALDQLSLTIERGEFIALLGPSGCGKSTALNCMAGLLPLSGGSIWLDQQRIDTLPPEKRGFGMVFQNYALFPHLTVSRNVGFGLKMRGVPAAEIDKRVAAALDTVQLQGHADKLPGQLSGGQQQRVAIARAIVIEPPLILMDEPLSNLDAKLRIEMRSEIRRIHRAQGCSTVYVTHDQDEALAMADRVVVMKLGVVQQVGTPQEVFARPATLDVARFMGYRNVLPVQVAQANGLGLTLQGPGGIRFAGTGMQAEPLFQAGQAVAAIRPDEIVIGDGPLAFAGTVETAEYGGREWLLQVKTAFDDLLYVRTSRAVTPGDPIMLSAPPERVLVYAGES
ncbi:ABC-type spermidine/putrescine transport system, ATPase component [Polaromonas sp. CF318]|uniref:ABC transporter ATP-binding protein n=1 Tax=Polaromonas sp. CF318 TaxID=1144318 RepID=UPI000271441F|nr:ABC transporter ATP-binding protein [Polaromonas sp. CF318]EJL89692.1 ABC-type spermidine/putrescine transport system, ATPase component [Polaromonas sp. CF318]